MGENVQVPELGSGLTLWKGRHLPSSHSHTFSCRELPFDLAQRRCPKEAGGDGGGGEGELSVSTHRFSGGSS